MRIRIENGGLTYVEPSRLSIMAQNAHAGLTEWAYGGHRAACIAQSLLKPVRFARNAIETSSLGFKTMPPSVIAVEPSRLSIMAQNAHAGLTGWAYGEYRTAGIAKSLLGPCRFAHKLIRTSRLGSRPAGPK
jgi:hypothetical protein